MVIRKLKQKKIVNTKVILRFIFLCIASYFLIKVFIGISERLTQTPQQNMIYTLGASLPFAGEIVVDNNFPHYTHSLTTPDGEKIGLKSSSINLNAYVGKQIALVGTVKKYFKITPVVDVDTVKLSDQGLIVSSNTYFFVSDLVYLDFSTQPQLSAIKTGNDIQVLFNGTPVVSIERFVCSKILKTRDCTYLITNYIQSNKDNFESYRGYTFYKHGTGFWTTFDGDKFGFMFKDISDDMILDISSMFKIVNKQFVIESKIHSIKSSCQNDFSELRSIDTEGTFTYHDPYTITLGLQGSDNKKNPATCRITFDVRNEWNVTDVQFN